MHWFFSKLILYFLFNCFSFISSLFLLQLVGIQFNPFLYSEPKLVFLVVYFLFSMSLHLSIINSFFNWILRFYRLFDSILLYFTLIEDLISCIKFSFQLQNLFKVGFRAAIFKFKRLFVKFSHFCVEFQFLFHFSKFLKILTQNRFFGAQNSFLGAKIQVFDRFCLFLRFLSSNLKFNHFELKNLIFEALKIHFLFVSLLLMIFISLLSRKALCLL